MKSQRWQDRQITYGRLVRIIFVSSTVLLIVIAGTVYIFTQSTLLSATLVVLGVLFAFLQWMVPRSPDKPIVSLGERENPLTENRAYAKFIEDERAKLLQDADADERGAIVVRTDESLLGQEVLIGGQRTRVSLHTISGQPIYVAFLPWLRLNNYQVEMQRRKAWITVHPRQVSELDWRTTGSTNQSRTI